MHIIIIGESCFYFICRRKQQNTISTRTTGRRLAKLCTRVRRSSFETLADTKPYFQGLHWPDRIIKQAITTYLRLTSERT